MKYLRWLVLALLGAMTLQFAGRAAAPEDEYVVAYDLIQEADELQQKGQGQDALPRYLKAQETLKKVQALSPSWNSKLVNYRLRYLADKISTLLQQNPESAKAAGTVTNLTVDAQQQITALIERLRQSEAQNQTLQAKLREALSVQPAAIDPRELSKSETQLHALEKERDVLKATLAQEQAKNAQPAAAVKSSLQKSLDDANLKLSRAISNTVFQTRENEKLQKRIKELEIDNDKIISPSKLRKAQEDLKEANRRLAQQHVAAVELQQQKADLEKQLVAEKTKSLEFHDAEIKKLQKQIQDGAAKLKKQIYTSDEFALQKAELQLKLEDLNFKLAAANKEKAELEKQLKAKTAR